MFKFDGNIQILSLLIPLFSGLFLFLDIKEKLSRLVSFFASAMYLCSGVCGVFLMKFINSDVYYTFGRWAPDIGIQFKYGLNESLLIMTLGVVLFSFCYTIFKYSKPYEFKGIFPFIFLLFTGLTGLILTNDIFNMYVFIEIVAVSSFVIFASRLKVANLKNTFDYLILAGIGSSFFLIGVCILYIETGNLNFQYIKLHIHYSNTAFLSYIFIFFGFLLKIGVYPFQIVVKNLYYYTSFSLMSLMFGVSKVMFFALFKILFSCFPVEFLSNMGSFYTILRILSLFTLIISAMQTIGVKDFKNYLILSFTTSNAFIILFFFSGLEIEKEFVKFLCAEIFAKHLLCLNAVKLIARSKSEDKTSLSCYNIFGIFDKNLTTKIYLIVLLLSSSYLPFGTHFMFKLNLIFGLVKNSLILEFVLLMLYSLIALIYVWQFINPILISESGNSKNSSIQEPFPYEIGILVLMMFFFVF